MEFTDELTRTLKAGLRERLVSIYTILQAGQKQTALDRIEQWVAELDEAAKE